MTTTETPRSYRMGKRLEDVEETRRRIVEATVELHGSVGPAATTISAVAERAGVQRSTVYRHFEDEHALFGACTSHWLARNPWPRTQPWKDESDPSQRLRFGLTELYGYYARNRDMMANSYRDLAVMPPFVGELMRAFVSEAENALGSGWADGDRRAQLAIAHAVDFRSWIVLDEQGASPDEAADLMASMVACLGI
ncbi:MAG TPA: TetR/AcrR family transcriptional regulator [Acidimicrobiia bacterium]|nr:TetR/AcrR family transcriptional regulator [Acidimicrobiia bacterium]